MDMTFHGKRLSQDVHQITVTLPLSKEAIEDAKALSWQVESYLDNRPLTPKEKRSGWREFTASNGVTGKVEVGWRAEQLAIETAIRREADMAACPFIACTCGYHDED